MKKVVYTKAVFQWRETEFRLKNSSIIQNLVDKSLSFQQRRWREILKRILDVILFLGERGLAFRGNSEKIGDSHNGNFLGIIELLSHYDPVLKEHIMQVSKTQAEGNKCKLIFFLLNLKMNSSIPVLRKYAQIFWKSESQLNISVRWWMELLMRAV